MVCVTPSRHPAPGARPGPLPGPGAMMLLAVALLSVALLSAGVRPAVAQILPDLPELDIVAADGGKQVFEGVVDALQARNGPGVRANLVYAGAATAQRSFCQGGRGPDILLTIRRMSSHAQSDCASGDAQDVAEVELGRGALVLAVRAGSALKAVSSYQVYLALARDVPAGEEFRRNTAVRWSDVDAALPPQDIRFQLPPRQDGGRAMFDALVMQRGCRKEKLVKLIFVADYRTSRCITTRLDRVREIPREQAERALLDAPDGTVGIIPYRALVQSGGRLVPLTLDGETPTPDSIAQVMYDLSISYWMYVRRGRLGDDPTMQAAAARALAWARSDAVTGPGGLVASFGLLPVPAKERVSEESQSVGGSIVSTAGWVASGFGAGLGSLAGMLGFAYGDFEPTDSDRSVDLTTLMDIAGFKVKSLETSFGLIPGATMVFGIARELSAADREFLERTMDEDARRRPGMLSAVQRRIVQTIMDVNSTKGYQVGKVEIDLFPLPSVTLTVTPVNSPLSEDATTILRAIERVQDRISESDR